LLLDLWRSAGRKDRWKCARALYFINMPRARFQAADRLLPKFSKNMHTRPCSIFGDNGAMNYFDTIVQNVMFSIKIVVTIMTACTAVQPLCDKLIAVIRLFSVELLDLLNLRLVSQYLFACFFIVGYKCSKQSHLSCCLG
jgi:hypothetical protein